MKTLVSPFILLAAMLSLFPIGAWPQAHVAEPAVNLGDTNFLDAIAAPGILFEQIGDGAHSGKIVDAQGDRLPGTGAVNSISGLTHIAWISKTRFLGGWYGVELLASEAHVNAGLGQTSGGWGDMTVAPLILQWPKRKMLGISISQRLTFDFDLPVGAYSRQSTVNLSSHAWTIHPYYAITAFPAKRIESSLRFHYLWNSANEDPPLALAVQSTQAGQAIHFNATIAYNLYKGLWVGSNGYYLKQITDPEVNGVLLRNSPEQVGAIGPGMVWQSNNWFFYASAYHELDGQNRPIGNKLVLRISLLLH